MFEVWNEKDEKYNVVLSTTRWEVNSTTLLTVTVQHLVNISHEFVGRLAAVVHAAVGVVVVVVAAAAVGRRLGRGVAGGGVQRHDGLAQRAVRVTSRQEYLTNLGGFGHDARNSGMELFNKTVYNHSIALPIIRSHLNFKWVNILLKKMNSFSMISKTIFKSKSASTDITV